MLYHIPFVGRTGGSTVANAAKILGYWHLFEVGIDGFYLGFS
jgi:hypothetical protein